MSDLLEQKVFKYTKNLNILYVEDDTNVQEETTDMLESFFNKIHTASDGLDGIKKYIDYKDRTGKYIDLIITDLNMPIKDGEEMIADILLINPDQVIIVISAHNESHRLMNLINQGISNFIMKPINPNLLMNVLYKTCKNINNQIQKEKYIIAQSKMAIVGEMIDSITHQWKQPINIINSFASLFIRRINKEKLNQEDMEYFLQTIFTQTEYLSETVDIFKNFLEEKKERKTFIIQDRILKDLSILDIPLKDNFIELKTDIDTVPKISISLVAGELSQVIINIVNNAKDILVHRKIFKPWIHLRLEKKDKLIIISIEDNGGGIKVDEIDKVFNKYFTTQNHSNSSGVGLYMAMNIVTQSLNGNIYVENTGNGAKFQIELPIVLD